MIEVPFTVSARTARLIGRENVANAEGAVIELIKNCYDADADFAMIEINPKLKQILIIDNGDGMTDEVIKDHWMKIGTDNKESDYVSTKGRIKSGAKGIGRFALDRLGNTAELVTKPKGKKNGFRWNVDWSEFEKKNATISNVFATLDTIEDISLINEVKSFTKNQRLIKLLEKANLTKGTIIKIDLLRDEWDTELSNKIFRSLEVLTPPEGQGRFLINFLNTDYPKDFGRIKNETFKDYDYKIVATYSKNKTRKLRIKVHRNEFDYGLIEKDVFKQDDMKFFPFDKATFKKEEYDIPTTFYKLIPGFRERERSNITNSIGSFIFTVYYFKNSTPSKDDQEKYKYKNFTSAIRKEWLSKFGGIKLFRDNFRVRPYGEVDTASYDWLMLGERQGLSPAAASRKGDFRVRPNQIAGTVTFSRTDISFLDDKSSREGIVENHTFDLFKNILLGVIRQLEDDRSTVISNLRTYYELNNPDDVAVEAATKLAEDDNQTTGSIGADNKALKKGLKAQRRKLDEKEEELVMSRSLASAGILIASFSHEFNHIKNKLNSRAFYLKKNLLDLLPESKVKNLPNRKNPYSSIDEIKRMDDKIRQWFEFAISLTRKDRRASKKVNLFDYFTHFKKNWNGHLSGRGIVLNVATESQHSRSLFIKIIELDLDTIFDNLLSNSIEAFQRNGFKGKRNIEIKLKKSGDTISIIYTDSGPGISRDFKKPEDIFKAFTTSKKDSAGKEIGTGLGMWLLKSAVDFNKGKALLNRQNEGFEIEIILKIHK